MTTSLKFLKNWMILKLIMNGTFEMLVKRQDLLLLIAEFQRFGIFENLLIAML